jgi:hypothetical protein
MAKLRKLKEIETYKPIQTVYENQKSNRDKAIEALEIAKSQNKPIKYDLKR